MQISVSYQDDSPVLLNDDTRWIIIGKTFDKNSINERVSYYKFELNKNGTANVRIPTARNETNFHLEVTKQLSRNSLSNAFPKINKYFFLSICLASFKGKIYGRRILFGIFLSIEKV